MFEEMWQTTKGTSVVNQRNPFYTYEGMVAATAKWPAFCTTGMSEERRREAAAFLSNVAHETDSLALVEENGCAADNVCTQYAARRTARPTTAADRFSSATRTTTSRPVRRSAST